MSRYGRPDTGHAQRTENEHPLIDVGENIHINISRRKMTKGGLFDHLAVRSSASEISQSSGFPGATRDQHVQSEQRTPDEKADGRRPNHFQTSHHSPLQAKCALLNAMA